MQIVDEYDYRNAKAILERRFPSELKEFYLLLNAIKLDLMCKSKQKNLSRQIQLYFKDNGWNIERGLFTLPELKYDITKDNFVVEIEIGHERLVYAVFFKFLADFSKSKIEAGIMVVTGDATKFGAKWHNSLINTKKKLDGIREVYSTPILIIAVDP